MIAILPSLLMSLKSKKIKMKSKCKTVWDCLPWEVFTICYCNPTRSSSKNAGLLVSYSTARLHPWPHSPPVWNRIPTRPPTTSHPQTQHSLNPPPPLSPSPQQHNLSSVFSILRLTTLWSRGNIVASHLVGLGSIPGRVSFPGWRFVWGFPSTVRQMSGNLRPHPSQISLAIIIIKNHFVMDVNDLWCLHGLKLHIYTRLFYCWRRSQCLPKASPFLNYKLSASPTMQII